MAKMIGNMRVFENTRWPYPMRLRNDLLEKLAGEANKNGKTVEDWIEVILKRRYKVKD